MGSQTELKRYVFDTNVVVSALLFQAGSLTGLRQAWRPAGVVPVVSKMTLKELLRVLAYPKFGLEAADIEQLLADYLPFAETIAAVAPAPVTVSADADDQMFVDLAFTARVEAIVSGDPHLLDLDGSAGLRVIRPAELQAGF